MASSSFSLIRRLASAGESLTNFLDYDTRDAEATELGNLLDDSSTPHRYYYQPHIDEDMQGASAATWRVRSGRWRDLDLVLSSATRRGHTVV